MEPWQDKIDALLDERRPDRYEPKGGDEWLDEVAQAVAEMIPPAEARLRLASTVVRQREGDKTRIANRVIRTIRETGQVPLDYLDLRRLPLSVGKERVALEATSPEDLRTFAVDERRDAANEFATRNETCESAEWLASQIEGAGCDLFKDWVQVPFGEEAAS